MKGEVMRRAKLYFFLALLLVAWCAVAVRAWRSHRRSGLAPAATAAPRSFTCRGERFAGEVVAVLDGDTVDILRDGRPERVRLRNIDAPEKAQAFGQGAKQFTADLAFGQTVTICVADHDRYGRTVGDLLLPDGRMLNREIVAAGLAWWYRRYSDDSSFAELEAAARAAHVGLWADAAPEPPWEFRHGGQAR